MTASTGLDNLHWVIVRLGAVSALKPALLSEIFGFFNNSDGRLFRFSRPQVIVRLRAVSALEPTLLSDIFNSFNNSDGRLFRFSWPQVIVSLRAVSALEATLLSDIDFFNNSDSRLFRFSKPSFTGFQHLTCKFQCSLQLPANTWSRKDKQYSGNLR